MDEEHGGIVEEGRAKEDTEGAPVRPAEPVVEPFGQVPLRRGRPSRLRPVLVLLVIAAIAGAAVWYFPRAQKPAGRFGDLGMPVPVGVATAQRGDMPVTVSGLGTVTPLAVVTVQPQISGYLMSVGFKEGQH